LFKNKILEMREFLLELKNKYPNDQDFGEKMRELLLDEELLYFLSEIEEDFIMNVWYDDKVNELKKKYL